MKVVHMVSMPKTLFTVFVSLCTTHRVRMWNKIRCHKRPCLPRPCPRLWYLQCFCAVVQHTAQVEQGKLSQASTLLATKTLVFAAFLFLYELRVAASGLTHSIPETETQSHKEWNLLFNAIVSWVSNYHAFPPNRANTQVLCQCYV